MAFNDADLSLVGYGNGQGLWLYKTTDTMATVRAANYFLRTGEATRLNPNDVILSVSATGGTQAIDVLVIQESALTASTSSATARS